MLPKSTKYECNEGPCVACTISGCDNDTAPDKAGKQCTRCKRRICASHSRYLGNSEYGCNDYVNGNAKCLAKEAALKEKIHTYSKGIKERIERMSSVSGEAPTPVAVTTKNSSKRRKSSNNKRSRSPKESGFQAPPSKKPKTEAERLMKLQKKVFKKTTNEVFRKLVKEGHTITKDVRTLFEPELEEIYEEALSKDIPVSQWTTWVRNKVLTYLDLMTIQTPEQTKTPGKRRRLGNQDLIDRIIRESTRCENS